MAPTGKNWGCSDRLSVILGDFEQIKEVRMEMAKKYENDEFGPITVTPPKKNTELSVDEKAFS